MMQDIEKEQEATEKVKKFIELAIQCGRRLQSSQTGYIHYYYQSQEGESQQTIPILENVLFVLALLRSRIGENITEAKDLIERLLVFQNNQNTLSHGNFPVYLHEYPICRDHLLGIHLLAPFYWILKGFGHILGQYLRKKIEEAMSAIITYSFTVHQQRTLPYSLAIRLAAAVQACGALWNQNELEQKGKNWLNELLIANQTDSWYSTHHLADLFIALQMIYPSISNSPWHLLWQYVMLTWDHKACTYIGPCLKEHQDKEEPEASLYDLFLSYFSNQWADRLKIPRLYHLQGALIQPSEDLLIDDSTSTFFQGLYKENTWNIRKEKEWSYTLLEKKDVLSATWERTYSPFRFVWGNCKRVHTLVCQGGNCKTIDYKILEKDQLILFFELVDNPMLDEIEKQREISFYMDYHPDVKFQIEGLSATTFQLGQPVIIQSGEQALALKCELLEGEGHFVGHLTRGNRPSQLALKGENRFNAYDWHLFIRTIRRKANCRLKATIHILSTKDHR